jgi:preprotein translocase subunit SecD
MNTWHWRAVLYGLFLIACVMAIWPPYARNGEPGKIRLGLDLRGGTYLVLQVMADDIPPAGKPRVAPDTVKDVIRTLERRVNQLGVADPVITEYGTTGDQILVQLPGVKDVAQAKRLIISVAQLSLHIVEEMAPGLDMLLRSSQGIVPPGLQVLESQAGARGENVFYLVHRHPVMTGRDLKTARVGVGDQGEPNVEFTLDPEGAARFKEETGRNIGRRMAIVLDERVTSAPVIEQPVGANGQIRGHFTAAEADELAKVLRCATCRS